MKEIGGYLEFERNQGEEFHKNCLALNTGRNCLRYLMTVYSGPPGFFRNCPFLASNGFISVIKYWYQLKAVNDNE